MFKWSEMLPKFPGVYIEEVPSGVPPIVGVSTSVTAFVGRARLGEVNKPVDCLNFGDFERNFGGLWSESLMSYAVEDFFTNGGSHAVIVRVLREDGNSGIADFTVDTLKLVAASPGVPRSLH